MYIFYCAVGRALWDAKIFGIVLLLSWVKPLWTPTPTLSGANPESKVELDIHHT